MMAANGRGRPKLADISLDRDVYLEVCEDLGFVPAGLPAGVQPLPRLILGGSERTDLERLALRWSV